MADASAISTDTANRPGALASVEGSGLDRTIAQTRIFRLTTGGAPVTPQARGFSAEREVVNAANESVYGLAVGIWTRDISKAHRTAWQLKARQAVGASTRNRAGPRTRRRWHRSLHQTKAVDIAL